MPSGFPLSVILHPQSFPTTEAELWSPKCHGEIIRPSKSWLCQDQIFIKVIVLVLLRVLFVFLFLGVGIVWLNTTWVRLVFGKTTVHLYPLKTLFKKYLFVSYPCWAEWSTDWLLNSNEYIYGGTVPQRFKLSYCMYIASRSTTKFGRVSSEIPVLILPRCLLCRVLASTPELAQSFWPHCEIPNQLNKIWQDF